MELAIRGHAHLIGSEFCSGSASVDNEASLSCDRRVRKDLVEDVSIWV